MSRAKDTYSAGKGRTRVNLQVKSMGEDLVVYIFNRNAHIGAVAIGEYDFSSMRTSVSVITRLGHKDDALAEKAAHSISKASKKPVCVIAGVHLDNITLQEITAIQENTDSIIEKLIKNEVV